MKRQLRETLLAHSMLVDGCWLPSYEEEVKTCQQTAPSFDVTLLHMPAIYKPVEQATFNMGHNSINFNGDYSTIVGTEPCSVAMLLSFGLDFFYGMSCQDNSC